LKSKKNIIFYILIIAAIAIAVQMYMGRNAKGDNVKEISVSQFVSELKSSNVKTVEIIDAQVKATLSGGKKIICYMPSIIEHDYIFTKYVLPQVDENKINFVAKKPKGESLFVTLLPSLITAGLFIFLIFFMMSGSGMGGAGKALSFGRSKAKTFDSKERQITFKDVAGLDEEKQELMEVVDFLKYPKKYTDLGARIPKGLLLVGPPGTGKTYISRATAGEANVPFSTISGSDFVEMFVGVGASRVRDLFAEAKKKSPCIIFIDEIDAVGRRRGAGLGGGHDEREQTLNQLLVEMDGFGQNTGIILLAATNRPDILDPALLRPGRFDRQIVIGTPDIKGREEIFKIHSKNKTLGKGVNAKILARRTPGFTPADIENMLNEAALLTARRNGRTIRMEEIEEAITKVIAGPEKKSRVISDEEKKLTAYHEAGHAILMRSIPYLDRVHQITIIPRGFTGGFTMSLPKEDRYYVTKKKMEAEIVSLLGGRISEKHFLHDISTGASNDIERATDIAREMVTRYGFSEKLGPINYAESQEVFIGNDFSKRANYSEQTAAEIDAAVKQIMKQSFIKGEKILTDKKDVVINVAKALLEIETLDAEQFEQLYTGEKTLQEVIKEQQEKGEHIKKKNLEEEKETKEVLEEHKRKQEQEQEPQTEKMK
jgi:cell division protease FtsH